jgi:hypothetical protein
MLSRAPANNGKHSDSGSSESTPKVCFFTDASEKHWGLVVTQVLPEEIGQPLAIQRLGLLHFFVDRFLEISFTGA